MNCKGDIRDGIYNCFGEYDEAMCLHCEHNEDHSEGETFDCFVSQRDRVDELYSFLLGVKLPEGTECKMPKLSAKIAFNVIWFLQEHLHILPDNIEQCSICKELCDCNSDGAYGGDKDDTDRKAKYHGRFFCDNCIPEDLYKKEEE